MMQLPMKSSILHKASLWLRPVIDRTLRLDRMKEVCRDFSASGQGRGAEETALELLNVRYRVSDPDRARIPEKGPLVVVANHPFGAVEGLILGALLRSVRSDVKLMVNHILKHLDLPGLKETYIYVDPFGAEDSSRKNIGPLREALHWVRSGGVLAVFPAGEVSHLNLRRRCITDPPWSGTVARIIRRTGAQVLPVYFNGKNSLVFQLLGLFHPRARTLMLLREVFNKCHSTIEVRVGKPIPGERSAEFAEDRELLEYLRMRTYLLKSRKASLRAPSPLLRPRRPGTRQEPIANPVDPEILQGELASLPRESMLVETGRFCVFSARASQIPRVMHEIGRLREITFRDANEGTGRSVDLDSFDGHYLQLFLWSKEHREVVGGYRLGLADRICELRGKRGLYTSTLFDYRSELLDRINPAIELGRSFVRPEYQKSYQPLMLLWKGIGALLVANPQYRTLFGPVSINNSYHAVSRQLIVAYSRKNPPTELSRLVRGRHPIRRRKSGGRELLAACTLLHDIQDLSELVSDIEKDQKGIPILLKHYMKLGGEILAFSVDPNFSDVLDGLILVNLDKTDLRVLERYMGREGATAFLRYPSGQAELECA
jgi:putative hemolysin